MAEKRQPKIGQGGPVDKASLRQWTRYLAPMKPEEREEIVKAFGTTAVMIARNQLAKGEKEDAPQAVVLNLYDQIDGRPVQGVDHSGEVGLRILDLDV